MDSNDAVNARVWMTLREFEQGEDRPESLLSEEQSPEGEKNDIIPRLGIAASLIPDNGRYDYAMHSVEIKEREIAANVDQQANNQISVFHAEAEVYKAGNWGYKIRLWRDDCNDKIGSLQAKSGFAPSDRISEGGMIQLVIEVKYDHEFTKQKKGFSEDEIKATRSETEKSLQQWQQEYY